MSTQRSDPLSPTGVRPIVGMYSFYTPDPRRLAAFWADLMQLPVVEVSDDLVMLDLEHEVAPQTWIFQRDESKREGPSAISLDLGAEDVDSWLEVAERAAELGAERITQREENGARWVDLRDPDGNRFRVFGPRPTG